MGGDGRRRPGVVAEKRRAPLVVVASGLTWQTSLACEMPGPRSARTVICHFSCSIVALLCGWSPALCILLARQLCACCFLMPLLRSVLHTCLAPRRRIRTNTHRGQFSCFIRLSLFTSLLSPHALQQPEFAIMKPYTKRLSASPFQNVLMFSSKQCEGMCSAATAACRGNSYVNYCRRDGPLRGAPF